MTTSQNSSPTIRDVAKLAGVSVATISRYLNNPNIVSPDTQMRVQQAMRDLKYVPYSAARNLATRKTFTLGLLLSDIGGDFFTPFLKGIESVTTDEDYRLLISTTGPQAKSGSLPLGPENCDGLMVFLDILSDDQLRMFYELRFPIVLIHQSPPAGLPIPQVTIENKGSSHKLISHLIEVHHRRKIAYLQGPKGNEDSTWRLLGYRQALEEHHIPFDPALIGIGDYNRSVAYQATIHLMQDHPEVDAIFTGDDESAIGVLMALREKGISVPREVAVVGFDDQILSAFLDPPLTTIHAPTLEVGKEAARQLIRLIKTGQADATTLLPSELIFRQSCGCNFH